MEIELPGSQPAEYEAGEVVAGFFRMPSAGALKASEVTISLIGQTEVRWVPNNAYVGMYGIIPPLALHENDRCMELIQKITDQDIKRDSNGVVEIPFEFRLPNGGIPSSFKSPDGSITYHVAAVVKKSGHAEERIEQEIIVFAPIRHALTVPVISTVEKDFGVLSFASGKIILHTALVRKGHYLGESIVLHLDVANESSVEATPRATLHQMKIYLFGERHSGFQHAVAETVVGNKVDKHSNNREILAIPIPHNIPLSIKTELVSVKYFIHVTLDIPHAIDIHVNLPIVVCTKSALDIGHEY